LIKETHPITLVIQIQPTGFCISPDSYHQQGPTLYSTKEEWATTSVAQKSYNLAGKEELMREVEPKDVPCRISNTKRPLEPQGEMRSSKSPMRVRGHKGDEVALAPPISIEQEFSVEGCPIPVGEEILKGQFNQAR
jgi:hypothetical protein